MTATPDAEQKTRSCLVIGAIVLAIVLAASITGLFLLRRAIQSHTVTDAAAVRTILAEIVDAEMPPGYVGKQGTRLPAASSVLLVPDAGAAGPQIMLVQAATGISPETITGMMEHNWQAGGTKAGMRQVGQRAITVRGAPLALQVWEDPKRARRQAFGAFRGRDGTVTLLVDGPMDTWDWKPVDAFAATVK